MRRVSSYLLTVPARSLVRNGSPHNRIGAVRFSLMFFFAFPIIYIIL
jgi:hypothetical protein